MQTEVNKRRTRPFRIALLVLLGAACMLCLLALALAIPKPAEAADPEPGNTVDLIATAVAPRITEIGVPMTIEFTLRNRSQITATNINITSTFVTGADWSPFGISVSTPGNCHANYPNATGWRMNVCHLSRGEQVWYRVVFTPTISAWNVFTIDFGAAETDEHVYDNHLEIGFWVEIVPDLSLQASMVTYPLFVHQPFVSQWLVTNTGRISTVDETDITWNSPTGPCFREPDYIPLPPPLFDFCPNSFRMRVGLLEPGESRVVTLTLVPTRIATFTLWGHLSPGDWNGVNDADAVAGEVLGTDLYVKGLALPVPPMYFAKTYDFEFEVGNAGNYDAHNVDVDLIIPEHMEVLSIQIILNYDSDNASPQKATSLVPTLRLNVVPAGATARIKLSVRPLAIGQFKIGATIWSPDPEADVSNNSWLFMGQVIPQYQLFIPLAQSAEWINR